MKKKPLISIIMGSKSDWPTMEHAAIILKEFKIPHEIKVISAHRTPKRMNEFSNKLKKEELKLLLLELVARHICLE
jgi:5-(carboxyamino)imidazole ribonucleotide mutase